MIINYVCNYIYGVIMNYNQKKIYTAFMEGVCKKFKCMPALPALKEGFGALCEAENFEPSGDMQNEVDGSARQNKAKGAVDMLRRMALFLNEKKMLGEFALENQDLYQYINIFDLTGNHDPS